MVILTESITDRIQKCSLQQSISSINPLPPKLKHGRSISVQLQQYMGRKGLTLCDHMQIYKGHEASSQPEGCPGVFWTPCFSFGHSKIISL